MKVIIIGDSRTGKTSVIKQFIDGTFDLEISPTIGVDMKTKVIELSNGDKIQLMLWDTAGQERFRTLTASYFRGVTAALFVYDITSRESFENIRIWEQEFDTYSTVPSAIRILVGNKKDLEGNRVVTWLEAKNRAESLGMFYFETSARNFASCASVFDAMANCAANTDTLIPIITFLTPESERKSKLRVTNVSQKRPDCTCSLM